MEKLANRARGDLRRYVEIHDWAPDQDAVESKHGGMPIRGTEVKRLTISRGTIAAYRKRGASLFARYLREAEYGSGEEKSSTSPMSFARWAAALKPLIKKASWQVYKQAALCVIEEWPGAGAGQEETEAAYEWLNTQGVEGTLDEDLKRNSVGKGELRTSSKRMRAIPLDDLEAIMAEATRRATRQSESPSDISPGWVIRDWLLAAAATGLRPTEWRQARLYFVSVATLWPDINFAAPREVIRLEKRDAFEVVPLNWVPPAGSVQLWVHSTKHSNNRGNQEIRTLDITEFPREVVHAVARMVWRGSSDPERWQATLRNTGVLLSRIQKKLWPRRKTVITLYSARHQAMANWKQEIGVFAAAVLAGHGIPDGPEKYYSARANSWQRRGDKKGKSGGGASFGKAGVLLQVPPPGRSAAEERSLVLKAGALGMARIAKPNPFAPQKSPSPEGVPQQGPSTTDPEMG